jgi:hypothetical protein
MIANQTGEPQTSIEETLNAWRTRRRGSPLFVEALADVLTNGRGVLTMPARRPRIPPPMVSVLADCSTIIVARRDRSRVDAALGRAVEHYGIDHWSVTSVQQRLVKTGGRLLKHARYDWLLLAESRLTRRLFGAMLQRIWALPVPVGSRATRATGHAWRRKGTRAEICPRNASEP